MWTVPDKCTLAGTSEEETSVGMNAFCLGSQDPNWFVCRLAELFGGVVYPAAGREPWHVLPHSQDLQAPLMSPQDSDDFEPV